MAMAVARPARGLARRMTTPDRVRSAKSPASTRCTGAAPVARDRGVDPHRSRAVDQRGRIAGDRPAPPTDATRRRRLAFPA